MKFNGYSLIVFFSIVFGICVTPVYADTQDPQTVGLTLSDAIIKTLENNFDIRIEKMNSNVKNEAVVKAESGFDLTLSAGGSYTDIGSVASESDTVSSGVALGQRLKTGTSYQLEFETELTDIEGARTEPLYSSTVALTVSQELLKDRGEEVNTAGIVIARKNMESSISQLNSTVGDVVYSVQQKYWELLEARKILEADKKSLELANDLLASNEAKVRMGTLASLDVLQAKATAASREVDIIDDEQQIMDAEDELRELMNIPEGDPLWSAVIVPETSPTLDKNEIDLSKKIAFALDNREDLKQLRLSLEIQDISVNYSANQMLPSLALEGTVSISGEDEEFGKSWRSESDYQNYSIGLVLEYPLGNRSAKSDYNSAVLEQKQAQLTLEKKEQAVTTEVKQAVRAVNTAYKQIGATGLAEQLASEQLESETRKYEEGLSTNFQVLEYQDKLASALSDSTRAKVSYQNALDDLDKIVGGILISHNIKID